MNQSRRVLLDECVTRLLKRHLPGHSVRTVAEAGWRSTKDQPLVRLAEGRFDVFLTVDRSLESQWPLKDFQLGFVIVEVHNNALEGFQPVLARIAEAVALVKPGQVIRVVSPRLRP